MSQRLILADPRHVTLLADSSVPLVVTQPPPWRGSFAPAPASSGSEGTEADYLEFLAAVWRECLRVLMPGGRLCIAIEERATRSLDGAHQQLLPLAAATTMTLRALGIEFLGSIAVRGVAPRGGSGVVLGTWPYPRNGFLRPEHGVVLLLRKPGRANAPSAEARAASAIGREEWRLWFTDHWEFRRRGREAQRTFHAEVFERLVRMFSFSGESVLDPFGDMGTLLVAAEAAERQGVAIASDPAVESLVRARLSGTESGGLFSRAELVVERDAGWLPLVTAAPSSSAKPKRNRSGQGATRDRVEAVLGPNRFVTRAGRSIQLLGTLPKQGKQVAAAAQLEKLLKSRTLLLSGRDRGPFREEDGLAYVHLDNRTFVNGRMLREGLLMLDETDENHPLAQRMRRDAASR
jgi:DNA modification methylase